jgi:hypothetical protein
VSTVQDPSRDPLRGRHSTLVQSLTRVHPACSLIGRGQQQPLPPGKLLVSVTVSLPLSPSPNPQRLPERIALATREAYTAPADSEIVACATSEHVRASNAQDGLLCCQRLTQTVADRAKDHHSPYGPKVVPTSRQKFLSPMLCRRLASGRHQRRLWDPPLTNESRRLDRSRSLLSMRSARVAHPLEACASLGHSSKPEDALGQPDSRTSWSRLVRQLRRLGSRSLGWTSLVLDRGPLRFVL